MESVRLKVKRLPHCRSIPAYATSGSVGLDITAAIDEPLILAPGARAKVPTGVILEIPVGYEGQVRPRSGLAATAGITLTNSVGTIDSDYRGELMVLIVNLGSEPYTFCPGERIAQLIVAPVPRVEVVEVGELNPNNERGSGGFGSTGRNTLQSRSGPLS
ncbi:MAG: dUTP diphosphatase [Candidatus Melainabacteria bacterium]|nr:dUTP diphosphatase [Candidatus Melainabacteria bacterium]